jgi:hypothetical protein
MAKIKKLTNQDGTLAHYYFWCPGCKHGHGFDERWKFNGDYDKPTFTPSLLVNAHLSEEAKKNPYNKRCHLFMTDGKIRFLGDCEHELAGKTVEMEDINDKDW